MPPSAGHSIIFRVNAHRFSTLFNAYIRNLTPDHQLDVGVCRPEPVHALAEEDPRVCYDGRADAEGGEGLLGGGRVVVGENAVSVPGHGDHVVVLKNGK